MRPAFLPPLIALAACHTVTAPAHAAASGPPDGAAKPAASAFHARENPVPGYAWVDSALAEERRRYWLKCTQATGSRRQSRHHALQGLALFVANVPLEYSISRYRHTRNAEPVALNAAAFVLFSAALLKLTLSYQSWQDYERDRPCCRYWQEYAQVNR